MSNEKIQYHEISSEIRIKTIEKENTITIVEETLTPVMCKSDKNMTAYNEWRETKNIEISKDCLLKIFQSTDFHYQETK